MLFCYFKYVIFILWFSMVVCVLVVMFLFYFIRREKGGRRYIFFYEGYFLDGIYNIFVYILLVRI